MADWTTYAVAGRVFERLLVVCFGGLCVYLGHRLFLQIPEVRDAHGVVASRKAASTVASGTA